MVPTTVQGIADRVLSKSYITQLDEVDKYELKQKVLGLLDEDKSKVWIDEGKGIFECPYETFLTIIRKKIA